MPLDIPQYHPTGIENRIFNSYEVMKNFLIKSKYISEEDSPSYKVDYIPQEPDPEKFMWDRK